MYLDSQLQFDPAATAITATAVSTNALDMGVGRDMGIGDDPALKLLILVGAAFTAGGAATLNIQLQGAPDNGSGAPGAYVTYAESGPLALAVLVANAKLFPIDLPHRSSGAKPPRFYQLNYVVATGPFTAGTLQAGLVIGEDAAPSYPSGFSVAN